MLVTKEGQILVNLIRNQENTVFLAELANFFQHFFFPHTSTRIVRVTKNIEFDILFYQILLQLVKVNLKQTILFHQRIGNQSAVIQLDTASKRWVDRCVNQNCFVFFCKGLNSCWNSWYHTLDKDKSLFVKMVTVFCGFPLLNFLN